MIIGRALGPSEVYAEMTLGSGDIGIGALLELYWKILDGKGMLADWATCVSIPILKEN